ncbi:MAG: hypothetical protein ACI9VS_001133, partial [Candidatus Binatia bacterium]
QIKPWRWIPSDALISAPEINNELRNPARTS